MIDNSLVKLSIRAKRDVVSHARTESFVDMAYYYSTLFHELIHSTGHESRLNYTYGDRFGDELTAKKK